jgi:Ca2+-binding EF-hand superfamily protein
MKNLLKTSVALILIAGMAAAGQGQGMGQGMGMGQGKGMGKGMGQRVMMPAEMGVHFMETWDLNEDGKVTPEEATEKRGEIFVMFDQDENGVIDEAEYNLFDETRKGQHEANKPENGRGGRNATTGMNREFSDANGDGQVTKAEFMDAGTAWFARRDKNGDGVLTKDDFGPRRKMN